MHTNNTTLHFKLSSVKVQFWMEVMHLLHNLCGKQINPSCVDQIRCHLTVLKKKRTTGLKLIDHITHPPNVGDPLAGKQEVGGYVWVKQTPVPWVKSLEYVSSVNSQLFSNKWYRKPKLFQMYNYISLKCLHLRSWNKQILGALAHSTISFHRFGG